MDNIIILKILLIIFLIVLLIVLFRCLRNDIIRKREKEPESELASLPIDNFNAYFIN